MARRSGEGNGHDALPIHNEVMQPLAAAALRLQLASRNSDQTATLDEIREHRTVAISRFRIHVAALRSQESAAAPFDAAYAEVT